MRRRNADSKSRADSGGSERVDRSSQKVPLLGVQMNHFDRKWEREGLFCYANCLRQKQDMWKFGQAEFDQYVRPMLDSEGEVGVEDDIKALVQLGIHLCPSFGSLRFLPQFDPCWITFRRLFLRLTAPDNTNRPVFLPEDEVADRPLRFCGGHPDQSDDSGSLQPVGDDDPCRGIGNYFLEWENKFEPNLDRLRVLVEQRLASDSRISLSVAKDALVDAGEFILGPEYGFLWHVVNEFNELEQPVWRSRNLADSKNGETTEGSSVNAFRKLVKLE